MFLMLIVLRTAMYNILYDYESTRYKRGSIFSIRINGECFGIHVTQDLFYYMYIVLIVCIWLHKADFVLAVRWVEQFGPCMSYLFVLIINIQLINLWNLVHFRTIIYLHFCSFMSLYSYTLQITGHLNTVIFQ